MQNNDCEKARKELLQRICDALIEQKYDPIRQIRGYLLSDDPTYIPDFKNARATITEIDREVLLDDLLRAYLDLQAKESDEL